MRKILFKEIVEKVSRLCMQAAYILPADVYASLNNAASKEKSALGKSILDSCLKNADIAQNNQVPICQDTGFAVFFIEMGDDIRIEGGLLADAVTEGTAKGYKEGFLRKSIVDDPVFQRKNTGNNTPPVIHLSVVHGETLKITLAPKGGGSENMSAVSMLKPSEGRDGIVRFVVDTVVNAGGDPCPPVVVGVGIGGTFEVAALIAKRALLRTLGEPNPAPEYAEMEREILRKTNEFGVGPQGLGGSITALAVHIETYPCHIASLPVAVNLNCHASRHASVTI